MRDAKACDIVVFCIGFLLILLCFYWRLRAKRDINLRFFKIDDLIESENYGALTSLNGGDKFYTRVAFIRNPKYTYSFFLYIEK